MFSKKGFTGVSKFKTAQLEVNIDSAEDVPPGDTTKAVKESGEEYESYFDINEEDERSGLVASQLPPLKTSSNPEAIVVSKQTFDMRPLQINPDPKKRAFHEISGGFVDLENPVIDAKPVSKRLKYKSKEPPHHFSWVSKKEEKPIVITAVPLPERR